MKKLSLLLAALCLLLCCGCGNTAPAVPAATGDPLGELDVTFFNAGKADCFLLRTEGGAVLIDCGTSKFGKELVPMLADLGVDRLDALFITHFDKDHVGGADTVLENLPVDVVYEPNYVSDSKQYRQYREALEASDARLETLTENVSLTLGGLSCDVDVANQSFYGVDEENDFSLVVTVRYGAVSFLFTGDAENSRLSELLMEGVEPCTVLKVPHHGRAEKLSQRFFAQAAPQYAVITSDEENLEDETVVSLLEDQGTAVYLTRNGPVTCVTDGVTIDFRQD